ncbi:rubredoxin domain-containing protein [Mangrovibacterium diazotrophicum]|uniref:Rubredoxin n=1 Tax=Mangrovibacterium diazotrophicum TaxID=1261403 RepID=A0A419VU51_9BACT|nr:rubredoxin domain-containing protein [Mangrovibacterium diazotrophicum]RKD85050.1 rubredoxin [Mangrovibacterium diazotrophicum]
MKKTNNKYLYRVLSKGGVLSPALFADVLKLAEEASNKHVLLGSRQDILFDLPKDATPKIEGSGISIQKRSSGLQNVVSSYVCVDILPSTNWVYSGTFLKILDQFTFDHQLRVNIVDPRQNMVPLFYGQINFIASDVPNYWHLFLNLKDGKSPESWPGLVFTEDIAEFAAKLENLILVDQLKSVNELSTALASTNLQKNTLDKDSKITLPKGFFPYYEGLVKMDGKSQYWAGFYWRSNQYPIQFLKEVCELCMKTNVGKISFTPWKTFLIKDIEAKDKKYWDELIGRYGINMRHSSFELNWHLPLLDKEALKLKRYLVSEFDKFDIRTFGLSFAIQNKTAGNFTTVVIRKNGRLPFLGRFDFTSNYSVEHAYDFNPNSNHYLTFQSRLSKSELPNALSELTKRYYARLFVQKNPEITGRQKENKGAKRLVHQCSFCKTVYDERYGDQLADVPAGTSFVLLPETYCCQVCESPKSTFNELEITEAISA